MASEKANFTYETALQTDGDWGTIPEPLANGTHVWRGVVGAVARGEHDISLSPYSWKLQR